MDLGGSGVDLSGSGWICGGSGSILGGSGVECGLSGVDFPLTAQNCERIPKTRVSRFLPFYPLISAFQALAYRKFDRT